MTLDPVRTPEIRPHRSARRARRTGAIMGVLVGASLLAGCQVSDLSSAKHMAPLPTRLEGKMAQLGMDKRSPIMLRIYKEDSVLEVWKADRSGDYRLLTDYKICAWSGELGPKQKEGDRQAPEGFYFVSRGQMNPNSSYYLSFDLGFPNSYDRSLNRTGSHLMVHGDCSSRGCYAMNDEGIREIYALAREAFAGGQSAFQVQALPFRMTAENMARHADSEHLAFWEMLKEGADHFEVTQRAPRVNVCNRRYVFDATADSGSFDPSAPCPPFTVEESIGRLVAQKRDADLAKREVAVARLDAKAEREARRAEREKALATFIDTTRGEPVDNGSITPSGASGPTPPVASVAGVGAVVPSSAVPAQSPAAAEPAPPPSPEAQPVETPSTALGFAPDEDKAGFFSSVANSSRGLFRKAGSIFD